LKKETPALNQSSRSIVLRLWRDWMRAHLKQLLIAVTLMIVVAASTGALPLLIEKSVSLLQQKDYTFFWMPLAIIAVSIFRGLVGYIQNIVSQSVALKIINRIQKAMFAHLMYSDVNSFEKTSSGKLISRFTNDVNMMRDTLSKSLVGLAKNTIVSIVLIGVMFYLDWLLATIIVTLLPVAGRPVIRIGQRLRRVATSIQIEMGELTANLDQSLTGIRLIKSYRMENHEQIRANNLFENVYLLAMKIVRGRSRTYPILEVMGGISIAAILSFGGWRVISGTGTLDGFVGFLTALIIAYKPIRSLGPLSANIQEGLSAVNRSFELLDINPKIFDRSNAKPLQRCEGAIEFEKVSFTYDSVISALNNVSFKVKPGQTAALVGPSGAGKSTILNMILRFYDSESGVIKIDGTDTQEFTIASVRSQIAFVSQEAIIFDTTIASNIGLGRPNAPMKDIVLAAKAAAADEFISSLPEGYNTLAGENGVKLSGGQRQRISIARAILREAPILLLDEATSSLDIESEQRVYDALSHLSTARTTLVIAHRLSTIVNADIIFVVDKGHIIEQGSHKELLAKGGLYTKLSKIQFRDKYSPDIKTLGKQTPENST
jgi:subfamily B ATP-binding cassette protein MsbA